MSFLNRHLVMSLAALASTTASAQILQTHSGSLTTNQVTAVTPIQGVRPLVGQRGVHLDGTEREPSPFGWAVGGNPSDESWNGNNRLGAIRLDIGTYAVAETDMALPAPAFRWPIGRTYNARQENSSNVHIDSNGYQGRNWFQNSQPELVLYDADNNPSTKQSSDVLYLVYGAERFVEFKRKGSSGADADLFLAVNGGGGGVSFLADASGPDLFVYYDQTGLEVVFFGIGDTHIATAKQGQLWRIIRRGENGSSESDDYIAYIGDKSDKSAALNGYDSSGRITAAYDTAGRKYEYTYTSGRLTKVEAKTYTGSAWVTTGHFVEYAYYGSSESYGSEGDLKLVTVTTPVSNGASRVDKTYYRYYTGSFDADTNPGYPYQIKMIVGSEGCRKFDWGENASEDPPVLDDGFITAATDDLKPYADAYFTYHPDSTHRRHIKTAWFDGECGCTGGVNGQSSFAYHTFTGSYSWTSGYDTQWLTRTVVTPPTNGLHITQYFDEVGQPLSRVTSAAAPSGSTVSAPFWPKQVVRDSTGCITEIHWPSNFDDATDYVHDSGGSPSGTFTPSTSVGLVRYLDRKSSGDMAGFLEAVRYRKGAGTSDRYYERWLDYTSATRTPTTGLTIVRPLLDEQREYTAQTTSAGTSTEFNKTEWFYTMYSGEAALSTKRVETQHPTVSTGNNGSGDPDQSDENAYYRTDGTVAFVEDEAGSFTYTAFTNGLLVKQIEDAQTNHSSDFGTADDPNTAFGITESGVGVRRVTTNEYIYEDVLSATTMYVGSADELRSRSYTLVLDDGRMVHLAVPREVGAADPPEYHGPISFEVENLAGHAEYTATLGLVTTPTTVDPLDWFVGGDDPLESIDTDVATFQRLTVEVFGNTGRRVQEKRTYFSIPASGQGTAKTHCDLTTLAYDDNGRMIERVDPSGTINQVNYDVRGLPWQGKMGADWGLDDPPMDIIWVRAFDHGTGDLHGTGGSLAGDGADEGTGDGDLSGSVCWVLAEMLDPEYNKIGRDVRGRIRFVYRQGGAPHLLYKRDGIGRIIAVGLYGDGVTFAASDDPVSKDDDRIGLIEAVYDERGRLCKVTRHQIDESDGSIVSGGGLTYSYWFDPVGRLIKQDADELLKIRYDGLGREYQRFILASDDDGTTYSNVYSASDRRTKVDGDVVLEEYQTGFNKQTGDALVSAVIKRFHTDTGTTLTGPLDVTYESGGDADALKCTAADVKGRIQITARWFDYLHRQTTVATYGTHGGSTFDRAGLAEPSTSTSDRLVVTYGYDSAGALASVLDAKRQNTTVYQYDDAGRQTAVIENYTDGSPGGGSDDDQDRTTRYIYAYPSSGPGLIRQIISDRSGTSDDQVTTYTYGTNKADTGMEIGTGHLLRSITYPDAGSGEPPVVLTYNINRKVKQITDQTKASSGSNENVINITYDAHGREATRTAYTTHSSFDAAVKTIETAYDAHGRIQRVTQKDASTAVLDEVKFTYDGWGKLTKFEQDMDSAVGASGGIPTRSVEYAYAKATGGRNTLRREEMTYPDGSAIAFNYLSTSGRHDDNASRVSRIDITGSSAVSIASYEYLGAGTVVGTDVLEPATFLRRYGSGSGSGNYDKLDRFDRVVTDIWQRTGASATATFYETALTYDENYNPTLVNDNFHKTQFDAQYSMDKLNRLQRAQEGEWGGSSFSATLRDEQWDLGATGNWIVHKWDRNGDGAFTGTGELNENNPDTGSTPNFNKANEILGRNTDNSAGNEYTLTHDAIGNLTDDGKDYTYKYDIFGRLREVRSRGSGTPLVAEYRYNGLGYLIAEHVDVTDSSGGAPDGVLDSYDPWYYRYHDERWRTVMVYRGTSSSTDSSPKERFIYHAAGDDGMGSSSYIDDLICRDRDNTNGVAGAADGTMEERRYLFQNYRHDVVAVLTDIGIQVEQARYTAYGLPLGLPAGDLDSNGYVNANDAQTMMNLGSTYDARADFDLNGTINAWDWGQLMNELANSYQLGLGQLSRPDTLNRSGYAGYRWDQSCSRYHVRHRVYAPELGRWLRRDPLFSYSSAFLYAYVASEPQRFVDGLGLQQQPVLIIPKILEWLQPIGPFKGYEDERYQQHDPVIRMLTEQFNALKKLLCGCTDEQADKIPPLSPELVKAWIIQESGGGTLRSRDAWPIDPAQVNVPGDWIKHKEDLGLKEPDKRNTGTLVDNLSAAICFLCRKGFGRSGQAPMKRPSGFFDGWDDALRRYNGVTDPTDNGKQYCENYAERIRERESNPDRHVPIELPPKIKQ